MEELFPAVFNFLDSAYPPAEVKADRFLVLTKTFLTARP